MDALQIHLERNVKTRAMIIVYQKSTKRFVLNTLEFVYTAVKLDTKEDFVLKGFRKRNAYIAALGPMAKQLGDFGQFWRMVWQQKVEKIVMVTNFVEGEKTKCEQYWPDHGQRKLYGDIEVVCKVERLYADFIWRQLTLSKGKHNFEERNLHHLQFTAWPDKDIPDDVTSIIELRQKVNALPSTFNGPVIVHCR
ncbi:PTPRC-like protein [Mya arenaria]|uniref:PTPRC-like protein n=1 Tax=Mya arenaria TaxID=6604 RepID=A0ABY7FC49_MYAAR|nr:PTPRC-like protein [Mya arenaria]